MIERFFNKIKQCRRVATRYDKLAANYLAFVKLALIHHTLVAIGAASFVIFASLIPGEAGPTRVAAQVVSGIGFLGAGIIFREGLQVSGLNTAATLWCSAAVGLLAGSGHPQ